jgi:16S rRNA (guanine527-N7)-methyltransferase
MKQFIEHAKKLVNINISPDQMQAFQTYEDLLIEWNEKFNLTAIRERSQIRTKHFLDSLTCSLAWRDEIPANLIDIGSGAGFPGIPLKIAFPVLEVVLVESIGKKASFCRHIIDTLNLKSIKVCTERVEVIGQNPQYREKFDFAVARAVANLPTLAEYMLPLVKTGGLVLAQKGDGAEKEIHTAEKAIDLLGGRAKQLLPVRLPDVEGERFLVIIEKVKNTPSQYPRRVGVPSGKPLI